MSPRAPKGRAVPARNAAQEPARVRERILRAFSAQGEALGHSRRRDGRARHRAPHERDDALQALRLEGRAGRRRWSTPGRSSSRRSRRSSGTRWRAAAPRSRCCSPGPTPGRRASRRCHPPSSTTSTAITPRVGALQGADRGAEDGGRKYLGPFLRDDLHAPTVFLMLDYLVMQASDPRFVERLGISRREAVRTAVSVWGGGALLQRAKLRPLPSDRPPRRS